MLAAAGTVDGVAAVVFASDATIQGGAMGEDGCKVILVAYERALADGVPVVGLWHSGGARLREGVVLAARRRRGLRDHDPRLRQDPADLAS